MRKAEYDLLLSEPLYIKQEEYWIEKLSGELNRTGFNSDFHRTKVIEKKEMEFIIPDQVWEDLARMSKKMDMSMYLILLTCFKSLIFFYTGNEDIAVVSPVYEPNCTDQTLNQAVIIRNNVNRNLTFKQLLLQIRETVLEAYEHQDFPFEKILESLDISQETDALFDVVCLLKNIHDHVDLELHQSQIVFSFEILEDSLRAEVVYNGKLFREATIKQLTKHYICILEQFIANPQIKLSEATILSEKERENILFNFNDTQAEYPKDLTIHQIFEKQVEKTPDQVGVVFGEEELVYQELNNRANQLATSLRQRGVKPNQPVAIMVERSLEMVVGMMAILKAGGSYVPINPDYPVDRITYMLEDSGAEILLTHQGFADKIDYAAEILDLEDHSLYVGDGANLQHVNTPQDIAYIIYTSGSTGRPKGVMISHRSLNNFLFSIYQSYQEKIGIEDRCLSLANISFDVSVCEIFMPLVFGATLVLFNTDKVLDLHKLVRTIVDKEITFALIPPNILKETHQLLAKEEVQLNKMLVGIEPIKDYVLEDYMSLHHDMQILNAYGPTEATICATFYSYGQVVPMGRNVPIGQPLANTQIYILDQNLEPVPLGVAGEIYIAGDGLAECYLNQEELTKERFVSNPFIPGSRMYRTGDLARWLLDGNVEFLGRIDHQVKIRGFRIEPGEIESQLLLNEMIKEALVIPREDEAGAKYLCAYVVSDQEITVSKLREHLSKTLPEYMIPSYFVQLSKMPLNINGKIDRKALPEPKEQLVTGAEYEAPRNQTEEMLVLIWKEVLGVDHLGINDHFFELGGHSLKAAEIVSKIHKELNIAVPLSTLFEHTNIKEVAACIADITESEYEPIQPVEEAEYYLVSSAQRRVYILEQLEDANVAYNMPGAIVIEGNLEHSRFEDAIQQLMVRHETLRTSFDRIEDQVVQKVHNEMNIEISYMEASDDHIKEIVDAFVQPFNLRVAPLFRVSLVKLAKDKHLLLWDLHHIISDGVSMDIMFREFISLYQGHTLPELKIQYKDFSVWQNQLFENGAMEAQEKYWEDTFSSEIPVLNIPTDYPRPVAQSFKGDIVSFEADTLLTSRLNTLAKANGTTLYMVLLAAYNLLLSRYSGQDDIIIGSPIAGRSHIDLQNIMGMFVNTLAMRNYPQKDQTFKAFLKEVKTNALKAYENQDYPFEQMVSKLDIPRDMSRNPLFDAMFVLHNNTDGEWAMEGLNFEEYSLENTMSKVDMTLNGEEWNGQIQFFLEYGSKLFKRETMERMAKHYLSILGQVVNNEEIRLAEVDMLLSEEKQKILFEFNNTKANYPKEKTLHQLFEEQVDKTPEKTAVSFRENELSYQELNAQANQLARVLREKGVQPDSMVAIYVLPSHLMMIGILAILKSGGAYLPIDPNYPADRIKYVLEDSGAEIILTIDKLVDTVSSFQVDTIVLDKEGVFQGETTNLELIGEPTNLAYMIYTSGSTGKPKGVMVEHRNVTNFIEGITEKIEFASYESILTLTTCSFDIFGLESLLPLTRGLKLVIANDEEQKDIKALYIVMNKNKIEMLQMTPSRMRMLLNDEQNASCLKDVKVIMLGGEALPPELLKEIKGITDAKIYNMYGPTETTIWSTVKDLSQTEDITIGQPIANTAIYILGPSNQLQPIGVPGELCIVGDGLARGYWNRPELTAEKFVDNPFYGETDLPVDGERMYRTGDLARWLSNGEVGFLGRIDQQVKIRGYRIELGEIESQLLKHESVKETVVIAQNDNSGGKYLCAYIVRESEDELHIPGLKAHLGKELPDYMIPTFFIPIDEIPFTPNGKVDRKALPEPDAGLVSGIEYVAPSTEIEEKLIQIWEEVLGIDGIGVNHNFFDVGGNSINIIKVISLISKRMGIQVSMSELFLRPTVAEIAHSMFIENPLNGLECVVRLNKPTEGKKNVFILHTWEGIIYQYKEIAKMLEGEYNVYGIQAKGVMKPTKLPETLEEMITDYICEIKTIQPEGPYTIAGYCYGNWIAYKMMEMLEDQDVPIDRLIQIDENAFLPDRIRKFLKVKTVILNPYRFVRKWVRKLITRRNMNPMDLWPTLEEWNASKSPVEGEIKNEMTVRDNVNRLCTAGFRPKYIIRTDTYVIKSEEHQQPRFTAEDWEKQTSGKVWFVEIPGGHESIFAYPYVDGLIDALRRALEE